MKKVLIRNDLIEGGGVENVMQNLIMFLDERGYEITVVTDRGSKKEFYSIFSDTIKYFRSSYERGDFKRLSLQWLADWIKSKVYEIFFRIQMHKKFDLAIAIKEGQSMVSVSRLHSKRKYAWVHVDYDFLYWTQYVFETPEEERKCMGSFDKVVCVSKAAMESVIHVVGNPGNLCVRYNPINYMDIRRKAQESSYLSKPDKSLLFVAVGRLAEQKNYRMLIEVFVSLCKKYKNIELWIVGEGNQRSELEEKIRESGLASIKLLGERKNPYSILKMADCMISASKWESYGLAIQEAFVLGIPVVATKCPALEEVFDDRFGILSENTAEGLEQALVKILENREILKKYRDNIKQFYKAEILYEQRLEKICDLWEQEDE